MTPESNFKDFVKTVAKLRDPLEGCPWDLKQDHKSLIKYLIEEAFEAVDAIQALDYPRIKDELGDILLQVVLHSIIAEEKGSFSLSDVIININQKMIRRHPHVFSPQKVKTIDDVKENWEQIKKLERSNDDGRIFDYSILANTALLSALKIGEKTQKVDFDWQKPKDVMKKVVEELEELKFELKKDATEHEKIDEEYGDLLFSMVQLGRHLKLNPELSLREANKKFISRFTQMEVFAEKSNTKFEQLKRSDKEALWNRAKEKSK